MDTIPFEQCELTVQQQLYLQALAELVVSVMMVCLVVYLASVSASARHHASLGVSMAHQCSTNATAICTAVRPGCQHGPSR